MDEQIFFELARELFHSLRGAEIASLTASGERSSFVRFNGARVRQAGDVAQSVVELALIDGARQASSTLTLGADRDADLTRLRATLLELRALALELPEDPHLCYDTSPRERVDVGADELPSAHDAVAALIELASGHDFVGIFASGALHRGFASSLGHRLWRSSHGFNLDFTLYAERDKAAKGLYAGTRFDRELLREKIARAAAQVAILRRPERRIGPGDYRVYLTPVALAQIVGLLAWDAFGVKTQRTKQSALLRMIEDGATLAPGVSFTEDTASGLAPPFLPSGFARPARVELVRRGRLKDALVSPRSAREYGLDVSSGRAERASALAMDAGDLDSREVLERLGTGIYVTDTWYTNYSDPAAARITGMTRFATTWVEDGKMIAPLAVMRFDDTLYRMLGSELESLTAEREWMPDASTYGERSTDSLLLPGALVRSMTFTL